MPRLGKRLAKAAEPAGLDNKGPVRRRTKTKNSAGASAQVDNSSPQKASASKDGGQNLSSYWLMMSDTGDRKAQPEQTAGWDGLRNSQAQNFLEALKREEGAFYQSNCEEPGIAGLAKLVQEACPDHPQFENNNPYCDPSSKEGNPTWPKRSLILF
uniref:Thymocyte nuclear protein 1 n=1 Tax=Ailuropoda melanoleuca TaxID=9646 RepID=A0A7N5JTY0_AILME